MEIGSWVRNGLLKKLSLEKAELVVAVVVLSGFFAYLNPDFLSYT